MKTAYTLKQTEDPRAAWLHDISQAPNRDEDRLILITGDVRKGKSTFAFTLGERLDPSFTNERMVFDFEDFFEQATTLPPGSVLIWDEIIEGGIGRDAMTGKNRDMMKFFTICGERNLIGIALAPHIDIVDSFIRNHRATDWVLVEKRGWAKIHTRRPGGDYTGKKKQWDDVCYTPFSKVDNEEWQAYLKRKSQRVKQGDAPRVRMPTADLRRLMEVCVRVKMQEEGLLP